MIIEKRHMNYDDYAYFQGRKIRMPKKLKTFLDHVPQRIKKFSILFRNAKDDLNKGKILCLGARTGCEIKAAIAVGFKGSQGIDLFPVGNNVLKGDWHNIPFPGNSFENVYTNAIDHCYDLESLIREIKRVLKPGGVFFFQTSKYQRLDAKEDREWYIEHSNNFLFWENGRELADRFVENGFALVREWSKDRWENFILRMVNE
jgi:SAM-dependent methyltransferase